VCNIIVEGMSGVPAVSSSSAVPQYQALRDPKQSDAEPPSQRIAAPSQAPQWKEDPTRRHTGFQRPLHQRQIAALSAFSYCFITWFITDFPVLDSQLEKPLLTAVFVLIFAIGFVCYVRISTVDPKLDRSTAYYLEVRTKEGNRFCSTCNDYMPFRTKHCKLCKKCVEGFDHHCLYLNTCIAKKNYTPFFMLAGLGSVLSAFQLIISIWLLILQASDETIQMNIINSFYGSQVVFIVVCTILNAGVMAVFGAIVSLFGFHCFIKIKGITTYEWIVQLSEKEDQKLQEQQKKKRESPEYLKQQEEIRQQHLRQRELEKQRREKQEAKKKEVQMSRLATKQSEAKVDKPQEEKETKAVEIAVSVAPDTDLLVPQEERNALTSENQTGSEHDGSELVRRVSDVLGVADVSSVNDGTRVDAP
jgi:hypothetical protein